MNIAGIDEAGRGPALGPMVMATVVIEKKDEDELKKLKVTDSKLIKKETREKLFEEIKNIAKEYKIVKIFPKELDLLMERKSLNEIEAMKIGKMLNELKEKIEIVYVDSPDLIEKNFEKRIRQYININPIIKSEHKADFKYKVVGAASILAKVERDREIEILQEKYGNIGSGYSHDMTTRNYIQNYVKENRKLPEFARKRWATNIKFLEEIKQQKLF